MEATCVGITVRLAPSLVGKAYNEPGGRYDNHGRCSTSFLPLL